MANRKTYKKNDRPKIVGTITDGNGNVVDLSTATSPTFHMAVDPDSDTPKIDDTAVIEDGPAGQISYAFQAGDLDTVGVFVAEWEVTLGSQIVSFPTDDYIEIEVIEDIA